MSIFINSKVHLPSSCEKCPFNYADMSAGFCTAASKTIDTRTYGRKRHPDCPLTELPTPHGRLVDSNELLDDFMKAYPVGSPDLGCAFEIIENAETFIKAEASE